MIQDVEIPISSNLTLCYLKEKDYHSVIKYADKLLEMNPENVKILYRRGMAYTNLMEFEKAKSDLTKANKIEPSNKQILEGFKLFKQRKYEYKYKTQKICEKVFDKKTPDLYPKQESKQPKEEKKEPIIAQPQLEKGSVPYYIGKTVEIGFAIPLVIYKKLLEKPTTKLLSIGDSVLSLTDYVPIVGGLCKRTRKGAANIVRGQFSKYLDKTEKVEEEKEPKEKSE